MSTKTETELIDSAGGARSEPGGRAQRPAGGERPPEDASPVGLPREVRDRLADEVIDELLAGARTEEEIVGPGGVLAQLTKRLVERAMSAELTDHLGYEPHQEPPGGTGNTRNGSTAKTLATEHGAVRIETAEGSQGKLRAADRPEGAAALRGVRRQDPRALLARLVDARHRGAPGRHLRRPGRSRPDQPCHRRGHGRRPRVAAAAVGRRLPGGLPGRVGVEDPRRRDGAAARLLPRARRHARGRAGRARDVVPGDRGREVLDAGPERAQAARRAGHLALLRRRAEGLPEAIEAIYPNTVVQTCVVHLIRHVLEAVPRREREQVARDLKRSEEH